MTNEATTSKYALAPWQLLRARDGWYELRDAEGTYLTVFPASCKDTARLAAAAPALLEALEKAVRVTIAMGRCSYCGHPEDFEKPTPHTSTCWVPAAVSTIAQARGVQR